MVCAAGASGPLAHTAHIWVRRTRSPRGVAPVLTGSAVQARTQELILESITIGRIHQRIQEWMQGNKIQGPTLVLTKSWLPAIVCSKNKFHSFEALNFELSPLFRQSSTSSPVS